MSLRARRAQAKLTEIEKQLLCGDPASDGWKNVSIPHARGFMTSFLQTRGRYFPEYATSRSALPRATRRSRPRGRRMKWWAVSDGFRNWFWEYAIEPFNYSFERGV